MFYALHNTKSSLALLWNDAGTQGAVLLQDSQNQKRSRSPQSKVNTEVRGNTNQVNSGNHVPEIHTLKMVVWTSRTRRARWGRGYWSSVSFPWFAVERPILVTSSRRWKKPTYTSWKERYIHCSPGLRMPTSYLTDGWKAPAAPPENIFYLRKRVRRFTASYNPHGMSWRTQ